MLVNILKSEELHMGGVCNCYNCHDTTIKTDGRITNLDRCKNRYCGVGDFSEDSKVAVKYSIENEIKFEDCILFL